MWALGGCNRPDRISPPDPPAAPVVDAPDASSPAVGPPPVGLSRPLGEEGLSAAEQYAMCKTRVEGSDTPQECSTDDDCQRAGCSQEMCISETEAAMGIMSTCEIRPCYAVLKACGCQDGICAWSVGD
jgi:eight-cysteine-cluster-containing protein